MLDGVLISNIVYSEYSGSILAGVQGSDPFLSTPINLCIAVFVLISIYYT
jgi:hypothetical protein